MCGIFGIINNIFSEKNIQKNYMKGKGRGPESNKLLNINEKIVFGFHRLAINGVQDKEAEQPFNINGIMLICNGEIYNWKELYSIMGIQGKSRSDCEVIIYLYERYGILQTLQMLDGVFAFALYDTNINKIYLARDRFGIRPMFIRKIYSNFEHPFIQTETYLFASTMKSIVRLGLESEYNKINQVTPGTYSMFSFNSDGVFMLKKHNIPFININVIPSSFKLINTNNDIEQVCEKIKLSLTNAVLKRIDNTERKIACLLSGGLDSSLIAALVQKYSNKQISTWSIGMKGSEDLKYAKMVAEHIGSDHHEIIVTEDDFLNSIEKVIYAIESYDTTTVRASVGNWYISKMIKEMSDCKVVFNGDGSDEVCGGYMYFHAAPDSIAFDAECKRLLRDIHYFDVLRSDRSISCHGLEARTPFLDQNFVDTYLRININMRNHSKNDQCEKYLLRMAFSNIDLLPDEVLWRTKEAFSDGVSSEKKSWFEVIQDHMLENIFVNSKPEIILTNQQKYYTHNTPQTLEQLHYRIIYESYFGKSGHTIPYFWMPKFVEATDASARTLDIYKNKMSSNNNQKENYSGESKNEKLLEN